MNYLSLFSGVGGLDLGLDRAGMTCVGQVEIDEFCRKVLAKHWPDVERHDDVRTAPAWWAGDARPVVDVVAGGFPCQPFSYAGRHRGTADNRWGWPWMADVIRHVRPSYVVVENVPGLVRDGNAFGWMLGDLHELGFDAEWSIVSACAMGAPHTRERLFVLAYPSGVRLQQRRRLEHQTVRGERHLHHWAAEPEPHRVADGVPRRMDRNRVLGAAVVPQVAEFVGRWIVSSNENSASRRLCERHREEWLHWLDFRAPALPRMANSAAYDDTAAWHADAMRARFSEWKRTIRYHQELIVRDCVSRCSVDEGAAA